MSCERLGFRYPHPHAGKVPPAGRQGLSTSPVCLQGLEEGLAHSRCSISVCGMEGGKERERKRAGSLGPSRPFLVATFSSLCSTEKNEPKMVSRHRRAGRPLMGCDGHRWPPDAPPLTPGSRAACPLGAGVAAHAAGPAGRAVTGSPRPRCSRHRAQDVQAGLGVPPLPQGKCHQHPGWGPGPGGDLWWPL